MTAEPDLLPLPEWTKRDDAGQNMVPSEIRVAMNAYAHANVAHATAAKDAEIEALRAEVERLRNKLQAMHRRAQTAEAAHVEYKKLMAIPPDGDGVRFVNGSLGRVLLGSYCYKLREEAERAEALAEALRFFRDRFAAHMDDSDRAAIDVALHPTAAQENDDA